MEESFDIRATWKQSYSMRSTASHLGSNSTVQQVVCPEKHPEEVVPVIDLARLGDSDYSRFELQKLKHACTEIGFFQLVNHGISLTEIRKLFNTAAQFFSLPLEEKQQLEMSEGGHGTWPTRGYFGTMTENLDQCNAEKHYTGDNKEGIDLGIEQPFPGFMCYAPTTKWHIGNKWPNPVKLPTFRPLVENYLQKVLILGKEVVRNFARILEIDEDKFLELFHSPAVNLRFLHYPPLESEHSSKSSVKAGAHTDYGCCTFLLQDSAGGLQVMNSNFVWIDVPPVEGAFVINIGDMLSAWTGGLLKATMHRVIQKENAYGHRYSIPCFWNPSPNVTITKLTDTCQKDVGDDIATDEEYSRVEYNALGRTVDDYMAWRYSKSFGTDRRQ